jgi:transmembrane sensor
MTLGTEDRLIELFKKYVEKDITIDELTELFMYISNPEHKDTVIRFMDEQNREVQTDISVHDIDWETMYNTITQSDNKLKKRSIRYNLLAIAAVIAVVFGGLGLYLVVTSDEGVNQELVIKNDVSPVLNVATLTLSNGKVINLSDSTTGTLRLDDGIVLQRNAKGEITYLINDQEGNDERHTLSTPYGGTFTVVLSDGTKVWLNASSSMVFPKSFTAKERRVDIVGEAYFEVAKDTKRPFYVNTGRSEVRVLGTHFNVMAYQDDRESELSLFEGSVKFSKGKYEKLLKPGRQLKFAENLDQVLELNADREEVLAWKNNLFIFNNTSIYEIMKNVSRWYNVSVEYDGEVPDVLFTGEIPRNANVSKVLNALELTGDVDFGLEGNVITCRKR